MTVEQLIEKLQSLNPTDEVVIDVKRVVVIRGQGVEVIISFTNAAANGGLLFAGIFAALWLYVFVTDTL